MGVRLAGGRPRSRSTTRVRCPNLFCTSNHAVKETHDKILDGSSSTATSSSSSSSSRSSGESASVASAIRSLVAHPAALYLDMARPVVKIALGHHSVCMHTLHCTAAGLLIWKCMHGNAWKCMEMQCCARLAELCLEPCPTASGQPRCIMGTPGYGTVGGISSRHTQQHWAWTWRSEGTVISALKSSDFSLHCTVAELNRDFIDPPSRGGQNKCKSPRFECLTVRGHTLHVYGRSYGVVMGWQ